MAGLGAGALAAAYGLQTAGLELTTVTSTGFITGLYVVFTPLLALAAFRTLTAGPRLGRGRARRGRALLLSGAPGGSWLGNMLVLGNAVAQSLQIVAMERFAPRYDPRALTFLQMRRQFAGFAVFAVAAGQVEALPMHRPGTRWSSRGSSQALGYLVATWVQSRTTRTGRARVHAGSRSRRSSACALSEHLGWAGWAGCAVMLTGILLAEPARPRPGRSARPDTRG